MSVSEAYTQVLKSYEDNPKVHILRKIRGAKALKAAAVAMAVPQPGGWLAGWTGAEKAGARGFLYRRKLRTKEVTGFKLISRRGGEDSILGQEVSEKAAEALLQAFR